MKRKTLKFLSIGIVGIAATAAAVQPVMATENIPLSEESSEDNGQVSIVEPSSEETSSEENSETPPDVAPELSPSTVVIDAYNTDAGRYMDDATFEVFDNSGSLITFTKTGSGRYEVASSGGDRYVETYNGSVEIRGLNGSYVVRNTTPDGDIRCNTSEQTFSISPEERRSITFEYSSNYGTLRVTFVGEDESAIPNAVFKIRNANGNTIYFSDNGGVFEYNGNSSMSEISTNSVGMAVLHLPGGRYTIEQVSAPAEYNGDMVTKEVTVNNQEDVSISLVNVKKYGNLTVSVTDAGDSKIMLSGASFVITAANGDNVYVTGDRGKYAFSRTSGNNSLVSNGGSIEITGLPEGAYTISQKGGAEGYEISADKQFDIKSNNTTNISFRNEKSVGSIKITVNDEERGKPIEGFRYKILAEDKETALKFRMSAKGYTYDENGKEEVESDENGEILLEKLPVGVYYLQQTQAAAGYLMDIDAIEQQVESGKEGSYSLKAVKSNSTIAIVDADGNAVKDVSFEIVDANGEKILEDVTDEKGQYVLSGIKEGKYKLNITKVPATFAKYDKTMEFSLDAKGEAKDLGRITLEFNKATLNLGEEGIEVVLANSSDGSTITVKTDKSGIATFSKLAYGDYTIKLSDETIKFSPIEFTVDENFSMVAFNVTLEAVADEAAPEEDSVDTGSIAPTEAPVAEKKVNNKVIIIIIAILVGLAGGISGYFYSKKKKSEKADMDDAVKVGYDEDGNVVLFSEEEVSDADSEDMEDSEDEAYEDAEESEDELDDTDADEDSLNSADTPADAGDKENPEDTAEDLVETESFAQTVSDDADTEDKAESYGLLGEKSDTIIKDEQEN